MIEGPIQTNNGGLVFYFDAKEPKSYIGQPTINQYSNSNFSTGNANNWTFASWDGANYSYSVQNTLGPFNFNSNALLIKKTGSTTYAHFHQGNGGKYVSGNTYTLSCYVKGSGTLYGQTQSGFTGGGAAITLDPNSWKRFSYSVVSSTNANYPYWAAENVDYVYFAFAQSELKNNATQWTDFSRTVTNGLLDLTGGSTISLANAGFDASSLIDFNGSSNYINVPHNSTIALSNAMSWEFILYPTEISYYKSVFSKSNYGNSTGYICLHTSGSSLRLETSDVASSTRYLDTSFSSVLTLNTYVFCTLTYDGSNFRLYKNGILNGTIAWTYGIGSNTADFQIGLGWPGYWKGKIESFKIYNRTLSASEILKNFNSQRSRYSV